MSTIADDLIIISKVGSYTAYQTWSTCFGQSDGNQGSIRVHVKSGQEINTHPVISVPNTMHLYVHVYIHLHMMSFHPCHNHTWGMQRAAGCVCVHVFSAGFDVGYSCGWTYAHKASHVNCKQSTSTLCTLQSSLSTHFNPISQGPGENLVVTVPFFFSF